MPAGPDRVPSKSKKKSKGGPLEIENFFVEGGLRKGFEGGQEPSKTPLRLFNQQKNKIFKSGYNGTLRCK